VRRDELVLHGSLVFVIVFWGLAFTAIKVALEHMSWVTLTLLRFSTAAVPFAIYLAWARPKPPIARKDLPMVALLGFLGFTGYHLFLNLGEADPRTTAGTSALVIASVPAFMAVLAVVLLKEQVTDVLNSLTYRERKVLGLRFGLEDGRSRTLEEVGREFQVTRERIRQIEAKALRKLRHPSRSKKLKDYLE